MEMVFSSVFKFRDAGFKGIDQLYNGYLWFAPATKFLDEDEGKFELKDDVSLSDLVSYMKQQLIAAGRSPIDAEQRLTELVVKGKFYDLAITSLAEYHQNFQAMVAGFCHLSLAGNLRAYPEHNNAGNLHLWTHYANDFNGYALEFDAEGLFDSLKQKNKGVKLVWQKIVYDDVVPTRTLTDAPDQLLFDYVRHYGRKREEYFPEFECRFSSSKEGKHYFDTALVSSIYLGARLEPKLIKELRLGLPQIYPKANIVLVEDKVTDGVIRTKTLVKGE